MNIKKEFGKNASSKNTFQKIALTKNTFQELFLKIWSLKKDISKIVFKKFLLKNKYFQKSFLKNCYVKVAPSEKYIFTFFCLLRENFSKISTKENSFYTFPYKEAKFSKLKYVLTIKHFFSLYDIFFKKLLFFIF